MQHLKSILNLMSHCTEEIYWTLPACSHDFRSLIWYSWRLPGHLKFPRVHWGPGPLMPRVCKITNFVKTWGRGPESLTWDTLMPGQDRRVSGVSPLMSRSWGGVWNAQQRRPPTLQKLGITDSVWWTLDVWFCANSRMNSYLWRPIGWWINISASDWFVCGTHLLLWCWLQMLYCLQN